METHGRTCGKGRDAKVKAREHCGISPILEHRNSSLIVLVSWYCASRKPENGQILCEPRTYNHSRVELYGHRISIPLK
jgi:hypothetical protein